MKVILVLHRLRNNVDRNTLLVLRLDMCLWFLKRLSLILSKHSIAWFQTGASSYFILKVIPEHLVINPLQISFSNFWSDDTSTLVRTPNRGQFFCSCPWLFNHTCPLHWTPYSRQNLFEITFVAIVGTISKRSVIFELISLSFRIESIIISSTACQKSDRNFCLQGIDNYRNWSRDCHR